MYAVIVSAAFIRGSIDILTQTHHRTAWNFAAFVKYNRILFIIRTHGALHANKFHTKTEQNKYRMVMAYFDCPISADSEDVSALSSCNCHLLHKGCLLTRDF